MPLDARRPLVDASRNRGETGPTVDELLAERIGHLIELHPTYGYRLLWALLRKAGLRVNKKAVYRVLKVKGWLVHQRRTTPRPRVQARRSRAEKSNTRWAMDVTHIPCGEDGLESRRVGRFGSGTVFEGVNMEPRQCQRIGKLRFGQQE